MFKPLDICNCCRSQGNDSIIVGLLYVVSTIVNGVFSPVFFILLLIFVFFLVLQSSRFLFYTFYRLGMQYVIVVISDHTHLLFVLLG